MRSLTVHIANLILKRRKEVGVIAGTGSGGAGYLANQLPSLPSSPFAALRTWERIWAVKEVVGMDRNFGS